MLDGKKIIYASKLKETNKKKEEDLKIIKIHLIWAKVLQKNKEEELKK